MEDQVITNDVSTGVDAADVAGLQADTTVPQEPTPQPAKPGVDQGQDAAAGGGDATADDPTEKAFAKRLAAEREKLEKQYAPYKGFIEAESAKYNMTPDQYLQAVDQQRQEQERQALLDSGIDPDALNSAVDRHPAIQQAKQVLVKQSMAALKDAPFFDELSPQAMQAVQINPGLDVNTAYAFLLGQKLLSGGLDTLVGKAKTQAEQAAVQKLMKNASSSPGALGGESPEHKYGYSSLSPEEKRKFRERVRRGEITSLDQI